MNAPDPSDSQLFFRLAQLTNSAHEIREQIGSGD
jgi:hypothetical protein